MPQAQLRESTTHASETPASSIGRPPAFERWTDGSNYNTYVVEELADHRSSAWAALIGSHFPSDAQLDILDIGCGPGFFECTLGQQGHKVTGIDTSDDMLRHARSNISKHNLPHCSVHHMDAQNLAFESDRFDLVISRNVTWTLTDPAAAYAEWLRVLKPGGMVLIYDANWHLEFYDESIEKLVRANERRYYERFGSWFRVCNDDKPYYDSLPLSNVVRPAWDRQALHEAGFTCIRTRDDAGSLVYEDWERDLYAASPLFEVSAYKPKPLDLESQVKDYWEDRAASFGFDSGSVDAWADLIEQHLPASPQRVLDVGTGTGAMAIPMAERGHDVVAADLCQNMVDQARVNARERNVDIEFICSQADELPFENESFDAIVNRNVLSNLAKPEQALSRWCDLLKPGGRLVYFDSNWWHYLYDESLDELREAYYGTGSSPTFNDLELVAPDLPLSKQKRPDWDHAKLEELGLAVERIEDVSSTVWTPELQIRYAFAPHFMVVARKAD